MTNSTINIQTFDEHRDVEKRMSEVMAYAQSQVDEVEANKGKGKKGNKKDSSFYVVPALVEVLARMIALDNKTTESDEVKEVTRLLKVNRYISNNELKFREADTVFLEGLYMVVEGYMLPTELVKQAWDLKKNRYPMPEKYGLPSDKEVHYATMKEISEGTCFVVKRSWLNKYVNRPKHWKYVYM